jgi:hypothetical protein
VILNIDFHAFKENNDTIHKFPRYFPYINKNKVFYEKIKERDARFPFFKYIPFYSLPYMSDKYLNASFRGYFGIESDFDRSYTKGYVAVPPSLSQNVDKLNYTPFRSIPHKIIWQSLDSIITICKKNRSKLIFAISPCYYKGLQAVINKDELIEKFRVIAETNGVPLLNYTNDKDCMDPKLFADPYHANKEGSVLFSQKFATDLLQYISR